MYAVETDSVLSHTAAIFGLKGVGCSFQLSQWKLFTLGLHSQFERMARLSIQLRTCEITVYTMPCESLGMTAMTCSELVHRFTLTQIFVTNLDLLDMKLRTLKYA